MANKLQPNNNNNDNRIRAHQLAARRKRCPTATTHFFSTHSLAQRAAGSCGRGRLLHWQPGPHLLQVRPADNLLSLYMVVDNTVQRV